MFGDLDRKDRTILYEFDLNCRQPLTKLAKKINIGKDSLIKRLNRLEDEGYIKGYITMINSNKFGLSDCKFIVKLKDPTPELETEIGDFIAKTKEVPWGVQVEDRWDFEFWYLVESVNDAYAFWQKFKSKFGRNVESMKFGVWMRCRYFGRAYLVEGNEDRISDLVATGPQKTKISSTDLRLLKLLASNARMPIYELAEKIGVSTKTVTKRMKRLEREEVIVGYRLNLGLEKLGIHYYNIHINFYNMDEKKEKEFDAYIRMHPNIIYDNVVLGGSDIELSVQTFSSEELRKLNEDIKRRFSGHIREYYTVEFSKELKLSFISGLETRRSQGTKLTT